MHRWIEKYFGSVEAVRRQKVVKVTNRWTLESSLFNELRAHRPLEARIPSALAEEIARSHPDPFDDPEANTPEDVFGRIRTAPRDHRIKHREIRRLPRRRRLR